MKDWLFKGDLSFGKQFHLSSGSFKTHEVKTIDEIIDEIDQDEDVDFKDSNCHICNSKVNRLYNWFHLKSFDNDKDTLNLCSLSCLHKFSETFIDKANEYEIIEYNRCSAYYKCLEIGNLRKMCERRTSKTNYDKYGLFRLSNFCEPGQAGTVLATYKIHEILNQFSYESNRQFKITIFLTILVILLTIVNLFTGIISVRDNRNNDIVKQLQVIDNRLIDYFETN